MSDKKEIQGKSTRGEEDRMEVKAVAVQCYKAFPDGSENYILHAVSQLLHSLSEGTKCLQIPPLAVKTQNG